MKNSVKKDSNSEKLRKNSSDGLERRPTEKTSLSALHSGVSESEDMEGEESTSGDSEENSEKEDSDSDADETDMVVDDTNAESGGQTAPAISLEGCWPNVLVIAVPNVMDYGGFFVGHLKWKDNLLEKASETFLRRQQETPDLSKLVYGQGIGLFLVMLFWSCLVLSESHMYHN